MPYGHFGQMNTGKTWKVDVTTSEHMEMEHVDALTNHNSNCICVGNRVEKCSNCINVRAFIVKLPPLELGTNIPISCFDTKLGWLNSSGPPYVFNE